MKLTTLAKRLFDSDTKALVKGGLLNKDLSVTDRGRAAIDAIVLEKFKSEIVEIANERIEEDKEECC